MAYHPDDTMDSEESSGDVAVALDTLATQDGTTPEVGDQVDVQVSGSVSRIEGDCAYVTPETCNGKPPPHMEQDAGDDLQRQAQQADEDAGY